MTKFVPYSVDEVNKYKLGETFKAKLRCGGITNAKASGMFVYLGDREESCVFLSNGKMYENIHETFLDIIEIEAKPFKIKVGKQYYTDTEPKENSLIYRIEAKVKNMYIGYNPLYDFLVLFNEDGTASNKNENYIQFKLVKEA